MTQKANPSCELADVALVDAKTAASAGSMSLSQWYAMVAEGIAPKPVIQRPRFTRYRLSDVAAFWRDFGNKANDTGASTKASATRASAAAQAKRLQSPCKTSKAGE